MYQGQERSQLLRKTVLTGVLIISQRQRREIKKKKIPLKLGVHCREIQATSHSARGGGESAAQRASHKVLAFSGRGRQGILIFPENKTFQISMFRKRTLLGFHLWEIS